MKKLNSIIFYTLITPAITLGAGSVLAQQTNDKLAQTNQSTPRTMKADTYKDTERKNMPAESGMHNRGYLNALPANGMHASNLIGADIKTSRNEDLGSVKDLIIDGNGQVVAVVVSVGGFLGMGEKDVAIGWGNVTKSGNADDRQLRLDVTRENLTAAPKFVKRY